MDPDKQIFGIKNVKTDETTRRYLLFLLSFFISIWVLLRLIQFDIFNYVRKCRLTMSLPGPPAFPVIGNSHTIMKVGLQNFLTAFGRYIIRYGNVFRFWIGPIPVIAIAEPEYIKEILAAEGCEKCPFFYGIMEAVTSKNLLVTTDRSYIRKRKMYDVFFTLRVVEKAYQNMERYAIELMDSLEDKQGETLDVYKVILVMASKTIMDSSRGFNISTDEEIRVYAYGLESAIKTVYARAMKPWLYFDTLFKLSETGRRKVKEFKNLKKKFLKEALEQRKQIREQEILALNNNEEAKIDETFLDYLIKLHESGKLDEEEFESELALLNASGTETSSLTLSFCLLMLAMHPQIQKDLFEEIRTVASPGSRQLTKEEMTQCHLLDRVIKEALRHVSPPCVPRITRHDLVLGKNLVIPPHTSLALCVNVMHKNPKYWSNPKEFYPDHFLPENITARPPGAFIPFITGIRKCPGYKYALNQMRIVVSTFILNYELKTDLRYEKMKFEFSLLMKLAGPYAIKVYKRQTADPNNESNSQIAVDDS